MDDVKYYLKMLMDYLARVRNVGFSRGAIVAASATNGAVVTEHRREISMVTEHAEELKFEVKEIICLKDLDKYSRHMHKALFFDNSALDCIIREAYAEIAKLERENKRLMRKVKEVKEIFDTVEV